MNTDNSIYVRVLIWAYKKQHIGFTKEEMKNELSLTDKEFEWADWMFTSGLNGAAPLVWSISGENYGKKFYLSSDGVGAAVDYLELKEAQEGGKRATKIALVSIVVSIVVGVVQIYLTFFPPDQIHRQSTFRSEVYEVSVQN